jgi:hypothetical protein
MRGQPLAELLPEPAPQVPASDFFLEGCGRGEIRKGFITDRHKLIYHLNEDRFSQYDLVKDPLELHNVYGTQSASLGQQKEAELRDWTDLSLAIMAEQRGETAQEVPAELRQRLKDMGYVQ